MLKGNIEINAIKFIKRNPTNFMIKFFRKILFIFFITFYCIYNYFYYICIII